MEIRPANPVTRLRPIHRHHGDQDVVDHQHALIADVSIRGPDEEADEKKIKNSRSMMGHENPLLLPVGGEKLPVATIGWSDIAAYTRSISCVPNRPWGLNSRMISKIM